jgi:hypothetical protein
MIDIAGEYASGLNDKHVDYVFAVEYGRKFDKVIQQWRNTSHGTGGSVHAFIERATGKLIKAATWQAPQKDKDGLAYRYDLSTQEGFEKALSDSDPYGSYLYKR